MIVLRIFRQSIKCHKLLNFSSIKWDEEIIILKTQIKEIKLSQFRYSNAQSQTKLAKVKKSSQKITLVKKTFVKKITLTQKPNLPCYASVLDE